MNLEWVTIGKQRHLAIDGRAICEKFGGFTREWANPCYRCLELLHEKLSTAFMERDNETEKTDTALNQADPQKV